MTIGQEITAARQKMGIPLEELARRADIDKGTLSRIEQDITKKPRKSTIELLERALNESLTGGAFMREEQIAQPFNPRFKLVREATGHDITEAARMLGLYPKTLGYIEAGSRIPTADLVVAMARLYRVSTDFLLGAEPDKFKGRSCMIDFCQAGQFHDHCCADCPRRGGCGYACKNSPERCKCVRVLSPERIAKIRETEGAE